ncbi:hypothetical protein OIU84_018413 [Salix udensis]|uniref:Uncharacterized protein n=1 Tax=Salix udensis TaxID=889485 RepID=A0AAD6KWF3_9ROSI|nr:hypothetical protein OIU84_018413 [Salix udensis]
MARSLLNAKLPVASIADGLSLSVFRRGYAAAGGCTDQCCCHSNLWKRWIKGWRHGREKWKIGPRPRKILRPTLHGLLIQLLGITGLLIMQLRSIRLNSGKCC